MSWKSSSTISTACGVGGDSSSTALTSAASSFANVTLAFHKGGYWAGFLGGSFGMRLLPLDIAEGQESRQLEIAREAGARRRVMRLQSQHPGEKKRVMCDPRERACPRQEVAKVAIAAAA